MAVTVGVAMRRRSSTVPADRLDVATWTDRLGRVVREVRANGVTATQYTDEPASGRLATVTDPKGQVTHG